MSIKIAFILSSGAFAIPSSMINNSYLMYLFRTLIVACLFVPSAYAGDSSAVAQKKLSIGLGVSGDYCYRSAGPFVVGGIPAFTGELKAVWQFRERLRFFAGFNFSQKGWLGYGYVSEWGQIRQTYHVRYQYNYIGVPLGGEFAFGKKIRLVLHAAIIPSYMLHERSVKIMENGERVKAPFNYIYDPFNFFAEPGIGFQIPLKKGGDLQLMAVYNYGTNSTITFHYYPEYLSSTGLRVGWNF